ncbi:hypothetical protein BN59_02269 [Legionella massiliensis]|uniref:Uncharacterized protein n=1 Tax=Legionella massiliensis TaxID=1034943 RepID=A0A078L1T1_9GAMM|nr:hypothetical protein [Legionella massiliensis]CDZ77973.1 hypothetical protein BN59_02269 [Legionella massiliensis]CEE13711.1 hypothetical protein BN1094_02269 [Legionella massiliensis]
MKRRQDGSVTGGLVSQDAKRPRVESVVQITMLRQVEALFSNNNYETLGSVIAQAGIKPELIETFLYSYDLSFYSKEILKTLADGLNQSERYLIVLHLCFEKACAVGCYGLLAYMLEHCENLDPGHSELRPYKELFWAYVAAREKQQEFNSLILCFDLLLQDPRVEPDKYALYLACLFQRKTAASLLLNHPDIDPNCLFQIMNERSYREYDPSNLYSNNLSESLIGWIIAGDVDGGIGDLLLKIAGSLEVDLIDDILCSKILAAIQRYDSESLIKALKIFTALDGYYIWRKVLLNSLFFKIDELQMDAKPVLSYMVNDDSFDWAAEFGELVRHADLFALFKGANEKFACELISVLIGAPGFHRFIPLFVYNCCCAQEELSTFKLVCDNLGKLSIDVFQLIVLPLLNKDELGSDSEKDLALKQEIKRLWLASTAFPKIKLLFKDYSTNASAFFHLPHDIVDEITNHYLCVEQGSFNI